MGGACRISPLTASISLMKQEIRSSTKNKDRDVDNRELGREEKI